MSSDQLITFSHRLVHRLDKDVSGCLVLAKTADSAFWLSEAFKQKAEALPCADTQANSGLHIIPNSSYF